MPAHRPLHRPAGTRPRRRHPARVYWVRRLVALTLLSALVVGVVGVGHLLTGPADGQAGEEQPQATSADAQESPGAEAPTTSAPGSLSADPDRGQESSSRSQKKAKKAKKAPKPPPARPDGPCVEEDVVVTPSVGRAVGGRPITIRLDLTTIESDACTWSVSPETLTMRITSGQDEVWTSRECPGALPSRSVIVRQDRRQRVRVTWSARRSDDECSGLTDWALPGYYHVEAAALAGEPRQEQFELTGPNASGTGPTAAPDAGKQQQKKQRNKRQQRGRGQDEG